MNEDVKREIKEGDHDPFSFNNLIYIKKVEQSKELNDLKEPVSSFRHLEWPKPDG